MSPFFQGCFEFLKNGGYILLASESEVLPTGHWALLAETEVPTGHWALLGGVLVVGTLGRTLLSLLYCVVSGTQQVINKCLCVRGGEACECDSRYGVSFFLSLSSEVLRVGFVKIKLIVQI